MAKILSNGSNDLKDTYTHYKKKSLRNLLLLLISVFLLPLTGGYSGVLAFIFLIMLSLSINTALTYSSGVKGEKRAGKLLENLPDSYYIIPGPRIQVEGKESEMDHVILGPNGIFVMESKNHNGTIKGSESDHKLVQHKVGQKGGRYTNNFYNPIKQVNTHVYRLSQLLKNNGYGHWIQGMVLFTNKKARVNVHSVKTPVFHLRKNGDKKVLDYIANYQVKKKLDEREIQKISTLINQAAKNGIDKEAFSQLLT